MRGWGTGSSLDDSCGGGPVADLSSEKKFRDVMT